MISLGMLSLSIRQTSAPLLVNAAAKHPTLYVLLSNIINFDFYTRIFVSVLMYIVDLDLVEMMMWIAIERVWVRVIGISIKWHTVCPSASSRGSRAPPPSMHGWLAWQMC